MYEPGMSQEPKAEVSMAEGGGVVLSASLERSYGASSVALPQHNHSEDTESSVPGVVQSEIHSEAHKTAVGEKAAKAKKAQTKPTHLRKIRIERMISKAELARRANLSVLTIDRIERGFGCRMDTKRKILEALGLTLADRIHVFGEDE